MGKSSGNTPPSYAKGQEGVEPEFDSDGAAFVKASVRDFAVYTPAAGEVPGGFVDFVLLSADESLTCQTVDSTAGVAIPLAGKMWHAMTLSHITAVTGGATVYIGWARRRPAP